MNCLCSRTRQAARLLTRAYEDHLRLAGLTPAQFELLSNIHRRPGKSQTELAAFLHADQTTLSRNLRLLVKNKWVKTTREKQDRRTTSYHATPLGERLWADGFAHWKMADAQLKKTLGPDFPAALALMDRLISATSDSATD